VNKLTGRPTRTHSCRLPLRGSCCALVASNVRPQMPALSLFLRQVRSRSLEHRQAMQLLAPANLAGQMIAILRQELDSMVRVIYLLTQQPNRRRSLIEKSVSGERWHREGSRAAMTDREMIVIAHELQGWTQSVYKFGCAFIHLSSLHDYTTQS
jgi:hypothetical protein